MSGLGCWGPSSSGLIWKGTILGSMPWAGVESRAEQCSQAGCVPCYRQRKVHLCGTCCRGSRPLRWAMAVALSKDGRAHSKPLWTGTPGKCHRGMWHSSAVTAFTSCCLYSTPAGPAKEQPASNVQKLLGKLWDQIAFKWLAYLQVLRLILQACFCCIVINAAKAW